MSLVALLGVLLELGAALAELGIAGGAEAKAPIPVKAKEVNV